MNEYGMNLELFINDLVVSRIMREMIFFKKLKSLD